ncbi:hypothetical protein FD755_016726, partial [Muntiacus reevesi]
FPPKFKKVKKKARPSEVDMNSPKSKKAKKIEEPSQDDIISPRKSSKKSKEPCENTMTSPKTRKVIKNEEPSEEQLEMTVGQKEGASSKFFISEETVKLLKTCRHVYSGKDLISQARTRTGKTFSLDIPSACPSGTGSCPHRELASQVSRDFSDITKKLAVACFYDHLQNGKLDLTKLKHVNDSKTLLFPATCPPWVCNVAKKYMKSTLEQMDLIGKKMQKTAITVEHLAVNGFQGRTIIFCEMKKEAQELSQNVAKQREITWKGFRNGDFGVWVPTNVVSRGLDIPEVHLVVQSSPPKDVEVGMTGICICFSQHKDYQLFQQIGVHSPTEIIKLLAKIPSAEKLIGEQGAPEAPAAALAHFSGTMSVDQRSLSNS